jgi:hypothetical protein
MTQTTTRFEVKQEQLDRCHRIVDLNAKQVFYLVQSATTFGVEYKVRYDREHRALTCDCPAGNPPIVEETGLLQYAPMFCWHKRAAIAAAAIFKAELKAKIEEQEAALREIEENPDAWTVQVDETSSSLDGVSFEVAPSGRSVPMR